MSKLLYTAIGQELVEHCGITVGQMFGKPCFKKGNKAFAAFFNDEMVFKLGREKNELILNKYPGTLNWDPSGKGRNMKDWFQISSEYKSDWKELSKRALNFVEENN